MENPEQKNIRLEAELKQWRDSAKNLAEALTNEMNPPKGPTGAYDARINSHEALKKFKELDRK